jgi:hypothetical protein
VIFKTGTSLMLSGGLIGNLMAFYGPLIVRQWLAAVIERGRQKASAWPTCGPARAFKSASVKSREHWKMRPEAKSKSSACNIYIPWEEINELEHPRRRGKKARLKKDAAHLPHVHFFPLVRARRRRERILEASAMNNNYVCTQTVLSNHLIVSVLSK